MGSALDATTLSPPLPPSLSLSHSLPLSLLSAAGAHLLEKFAELELPTKVCVAASGHCDGALLLGQHGACPLLMSHCVMMMDGSQEASSGAGEMAAVSAGERESKGEREREEELEEGPKRRPRLRQPACMLGHP